LETTFSTRKPWGPKGSACLKILRRSSKGSFGKSVKEVGVSCSEAGVAIAFLTEAIVPVFVWHIVYVERERRFEEECDCVAKKTLVVVLSDYLLSRAESRRLCTARKKTTKFSASPSPFPSTQVNLVDPATF